MAGRPTLTRVTTPIEALRRAVTSDPARPRLTWYDEETGERVELSGASLINWVNKTANLLTAELGVGAAEAVAIDLPRHWITAVWWYACDAVGALPQLGADPSAAVAVVGPNGLDPTPPNDEVVAVSLRPLGAPFAEALPRLVHDYSVAVRSQGDHFAATGAGDEAVGTRVQRLAGDWQLTSTDRVLATGPLQDAADIEASLLAPLSTDGSVVWLRNQPGAASVQVLASERVTVGVAAQPPQSLAPLAIRWLPIPAVSS